MSQPPVVDLKRCAVASHRYPGRDKRLTIDMSHPEFSEQSSTYLRPAEKGDCKGPPPFAIPLDLSPPSRAASGGAHKK
jgi:hypothetical protein